MNWPIGIRPMHTTTIPTMITTIKVTRIVIHIHQDLKKICTKERRPSGLWCHSALAGALSHARTPSAILLVAVAVNRVPLGMLLIVAFSIGLALILMGIGIAMVHGMRWLVHKGLVIQIRHLCPADQRGRCRGAGSRTDRERALLIPVLRAGCQRAKTIRLARATPLNRV